MTLKAKYYGQYFLVCYPYYHLRAQQIFVWKNVETASTFCKIKFVDRVGGYRGNKQSQLAIQHLLRDKLKNVAHFTWRLGKLFGPEYSSRSGPI